MLNNNMNISTNKKLTNKGLMIEELKNKASVKFSQHALEKLDLREIKISENALKKLNSGVKKAEDKGAKESLIMVKGVAYIVSIENKTVITMVRNNEKSKNVFTNIDSVVFM